MFRGVRKVLLPITRRTCFNNNILLCRGVSTTFNQYPFLQSLGLKEDNNETCYSGSWHSSGDKNIPSINPSTNETIATVQMSNNTDLEKCISAMDEAKPMWASMPAPQRGEIVRQIGEELRVHKKDLGKLISLEMGKIQTEGEGEVQEAIDICDFAVGLSRMINGKVIPSERPEHFMMERYNPLKGHVGIVTAFNFPCAVYFWNAALSLVCGNTQIWKGSETTSLVTIACSKIVSNVLERNNLPGAISTTIVGPGNTVGETLINNPKIELISFTGSTKVGRHVNGVASQRFAKTILELGGNNALFVMDDANVSMSLRAALFSAVGTAGQRCTTLRRLYLHNDIYNTFISDLINAYQHIKIGNPLESTTLCGPLHSKSAVSAYELAIKKATEQGGKILYGGNVLNNNTNGNFVEPTIIEIDSNAECVLEEVFVPILYVMKVNNIHHAIELNNSVPQGLSSALFTTNQSSIFQWTGALGSDCGIVNVNIGPSGAEIGGAFGGEKDTGGGRESGSDAWKQYCRRSTCTINYGKTLPLAQGVTFDV